MALHKSVEFLDGKGKPTNLSTGSFLSSSSSSSSFPTSPPPPPPPPPPSPPPSPPPPPHSSCLSVSFLFIRFYLLFHSLLTFFCIFTSLALIGRSTVFSSKMGKINDPPNQLLTIHLFYLVKSLHKHYSELWSILCDFRKCTLIFKKGGVDLHG